MPNALAPTTAEQAATALQVCMHCAHEELSPRLVLPGKVFWSFANAVMNSRVQLGSLQRFLKYPACLALSQLTLT